MINLTTLQLKISAYEFYLVINYSYLSFWSVESFPLLHKTSKFFCGCFIRSSNSSFSFEEVNNLKVWEKFSIGSSELENRFNLFKFLIEKRRKNKSETEIMT